MSDMLGVITTDIANANTDANIYTSADTRVTANAIAITARPPPHIHTHSIITSNSLTVAKVTDDSDTKRKS
eukprot:2043222-Alexandrium_andersonii.AAC.1